MDGVLHSSKRRCRGSSIHGRFHKDEAIPMVGRSVIEVRCCNLVSLYVVRL